MSLFTDYLKEREGKEVIEKDFGFCVYKVNKDHTYLQDVYIVPEFRKSGKGRSFVDKMEEIAKENGHSVVITSFCLNANNWMQSKMSIQKCGFKYYAKDKVNKMIYCIKELR